MTHYVYRLYDADGALVYIGCSKDPHQRLKQHRADHRWWFDRVAHMTTQPFPDAAPALKAERLAIESEHPSCNLAHRWEVRETWGPEHFANYVRALRDSRTFDPCGHATSREREARRLYEEKFGAPLRLDRRQRAA